MWCPVPKGEFSFKGKRIEKDDSLYAYEDNISLDFDFYGLDAKNYLSVNRQEFKADKKDEIEKQVCVITKEVVDYLLTLDDICEPLEDKLYFPLGGSDIFDFYLNLWQIADENQEKLMMGSPKKHLEPMSTKVKTLCWSQGKQYELKETKVGEIIENYKNFNYMYHDFNRGFSDIAYAYCCKIANTIAKEVNFQELVLFGHHSDINIPGTYISQIWLFPKADGILAYSLDNAPAEYFEMSEESKARYLKALYYGQNLGGTNGFPRRYAIPALKDYSELTLRSSDVPVGFLINDTRIDAWTISPLLSMDKSVGNCQKPEFIVRVTQSAEFDKLADYVLEHRADPTPCTKEKIVEAYKRLLSDYYDVMHEDEALKEDGEEE